MSNDEEYDFEYSEEEEEEQNVQIENQYYIAKSLVEKDKFQAIEAFERVVDLEEEKGDWGFKALKQIVKLLFTTNNMSKMMECYEQLLSYTKTAVTRNFAEKGINSILDFASQSENWEVLQKFYERTLDTLKEARNDRLWFKTNVKLGNLLHEVGDYVRMSKVIKELLQSCETEDEEETIKKGNQLLEVFALQIQLYTAQRDNKNLRIIYDKALRIKSAIPHPKIVGVIRECGGKMHMMENQWDDARTDFFEGFKNYNETGESRRLQCLKYLVLANMLSDSKINPFDSQEAKPYEHDPEIIAMTQLTDAFLHDEIVRFEQVLKVHESAIMDDEFIRRYIDDLIRTIRSKVLVKIIQPYTRISIQYMAKQLNNIPPNQLESLVVSLILDGKIKGHIDQIAGVLILPERDHKNQKTYDSLTSWLDQLEKLHGSFSKVVANFAGA